MDKEKQEVCSIRIMFPVISDEQAIDVKKKIEGVLSEIPESTLQFGLSSIPHRIPNGVAGAS